MQINWDIEKKKQMTIVISSMITVLLILIIGFYIGNPSFRTFFDRYILRKEITENQATSIDISDQEDASIYAFDKYITLLHKNKLSLYTATGKKEYELEVNIGNALYASCNQYLMIAQKNGQNLYQIADGHIIWQTEVEGHIQKVNVNKNGYVTVIIAGSSYKTIVSTYNPQGKELFKTYLSTTTCIDTSISYDNQYLAIAEINTSGTLIQSSIKIISMEKAKTDPINSVTNIYNASSNQLIKNVQYQDKNNLVAIYDNEIKKINNETEEQILSFTGNKITFASIKLDHYIVYTTEKNAGIFNTNTQVSFKNVATQKENIYIAQGVTKDIRTYANNIALNLGSEIQFLTTNRMAYQKIHFRKRSKSHCLRSKSSRNCIQR